MLETALDAEMSEHPGQEKHQITDDENVRNGIRSKTTLTEIDPARLSFQR